MKKLIIIAFAVLLAMPLIAQENLYVVMELMKVDNEQEMDYWETEQFWKKIHQERLKAGEIIGWDLWQLLPGGEDQGYQYATVNLYNSAEKMFDAGGDFMKHVKAAYPDMSEDDVYKKFNATAKARDLAVRIFMERIDQTEGDVSMDVGTIAYIDFMKVDMGGYSAYEKAETEVFKPWHQEMVNDGSKGYWGLFRFMVPYGSDTYASHITVNMFENLQKALNQEGPGGDLTDAQQKAVEDGLKTRDMKFTYMARLIDIVR
ncbi:hypothetical protein [Aestuariivivens sediminicola]|uniref:hypothetical protein n=1 Tax=Aestuariivivens sediminicola TaxID=2913560 RepID=UPI001F560D5F|nr:hypothetical protein [Aestuariivivens sediminicola]